MQHFKRLLYGMFLVSCVLSLMMQHLKRLGLGLIFIAICCLVASLIIVVIWSLVNNLFFPWPMLIGIGLTIGFAYIIGCTLD